MRTASWVCGPFYTDCTGIIHRLKDFETLRTYTRPPVIAGILDHPLLRGVPGVDAHMTVDRVARESSRTPHVLPPRAREIQLPHLLREPPAGALGEA
ncbi:hypothetical protein BG418_34570 [Streptomyces sp. CBMA152]|nr:hypothetical protein [Streptomyces sp. CBMA152]